MNAVVCITDRHYLLPTKVFLASVARHLPPDVELFVLSRDIGLDDFSDVPYRNRLGGVIDFSSEPSFLEAAKLYKKKSHVCVDAMIKLFIPFLFRRFRRVLYLDVDMLVCSSDLGQLFEMDLGEKLIAAVPDYKNAREPFRETLGIGEHEMYCNSGLVLFDVPSCLEQLTEQLILDRVRAMARFSRYIDQDYVNYIFRHQVKYLDLKYNVFVTIHLGEGVTEPLTELVKSETSDLFAFPEPALRQALDEKVVLHYTSGDKPWNTPSGFDDLWWSTCDELALGVSRQELQRPRPPIDAQPPRPDARGPSKPAVLPKRIANRLRKAGRTLLGTAETPKSTATPKAQQATAKPAKRHSQLPRNWPQPKATLQISEPAASQRRPSVRVPVVLDLSWAGDARTLWTELERIFERYEFTSHAYVLVDERFAGALARLSESWRVSVVSEAANIASGEYFFSALFGPRDSELGIDYLRRSNGDASEPLSSVGRWISVTESGEVSPSLELDYLTEHSRPHVISAWPQQRYDRVIATLYKQSKL